MRPEIGSLLADLAVYDARSVSGLLISELGSVGSQKVDAGTSSDLSQRVQKAAKDDTAMHILAVLSSVWSDGLSDGTLDVRSVGKGLEAAVNGCTKFAPEVNRQLLLVLDQVFRHSQRLA